MKKIFSAEIYDRSQNQVTEANQEFKKIYPEYLPLDKNWLETGDGDGYDFAELGKRVAFLAKEKDPDISRMILAFCCGLDFIVDYREAVHLYTDRISEQNVLSKEQISAIKGQQTFIVDIEIDHERWTVRIKRGIGPVEHELLSVNISKEMEDGQIPTFPFVVRAERLPRLYCACRYECGDCSFGCPERVLSETARIRQIPRIIQRGSEICRLQQSGSQTKIYGDRLVPILNTALSCVLAYEERSEMRRKAGKRKAVPAVSKAESEGQEIKVVIPAAEEEKADYRMVPLQMYETAGYTGHGTKHKSHASPREHMRSATVRHYYNPDGSLRKVVPVKASVVNKVRRAETIVYKV